MMGETVTIADVVKHKNMATYRKKTYLIVRDGIPVGFFSGKTVMRRLKTMEVLLTRRFCNNVRPTIKRLS